jgi:hypothetical protein
VIAVVGAVVLGRTRRGEEVDEDEPVATLPGDPEATADREPRTADEGVAS